MLLVNPNAFNNEYKTTYHHPVLQLKTCLPKKMNTLHVFGHQDRSKAKSLTLQAQLNTKADDLISTHAKNIHSNITNNPMSAYLKN